MGPGHVDGGGGLAQAEGLREGRGVLQGGGEREHERWLGDKGAIMILKERNPGCPGESCGE